MFIVLVQNPKGGGLGASFGGVSSNQLGGAKNAADFLEKATWGLAIALLVFSLLSAVAMPTQNFGTKKVNKELEEQITNFDYDSFDPATNDQ